MEVSGQLQAPATLLPEVVWAFKRERNPLALPRQYNDYALPPTVDILFQEDRLLLLM